MMVGRSLAFVSTTVVLAACGPSSAHVDARPLPAGEPSQASLVDWVLVDSAIQNVVVDEPPAVLVMPLLVYPSELRKAGIQGRVVLRCIIGRDGRAERRTIVVRSADHIGFISPAMNALRTGRFRPAKVRGVPVRTWVNIPFDFKIRSRPT